jgi:hypothetical protein
MEEIKILNRKDRRRLRIDSKGREILDSKPLTVPMKIPTIEAQMQEFTRLGVQRYAEHFADPDDDLWDDHLDDLPDEGLSPHEEPENVLLPLPSLQVTQAPVEASKEPREAPKKDGSSDAPKTQVDEPDTTPKE